MVDETDDIVTMAGEEPQIGLRSLEHETFAKRFGRGFAAQDLVDTKTQKFERYTKNSSASYGLGTRELVVEIGLRYLPIAAESLFRSWPTHFGQDLYPVSWRSWLCADLLRLFEEEEEAIALFAQKQLAAASPERRAQFRAQLQSSARAAQIGPKPTTLSLFGRTPKSPLERAIGRVSALSKRLEQVVPGLSAPLRQQARLQTLAHASGPVAELVQIASDALGDPDTLPETTPPPRPTMVAPDITPNVSRPTILDLGSAGEQQPETKQSTPRATVEAPSRPSQDRLRDHIEKLVPSRSPYPGGIGRAATFSRLIAAQPTAQKRQSIGKQPRAAAPRPVPGQLGKKPSVVGAESLVRPMVGIDEPSSGVEILDEKGRPVPGISPPSSQMPSKTIWLEDVEIDATALPALSTSLMALSWQGEKVARSVELLLGSKRGQSALLESIQRRTEGSRLGLTQIESTATASKWETLTGTVSPDREEAPRTARLAAWPGLDGVYVQLAPEGTIESSEAGAPSQIASAKTAEPAPSPKEARKIPVVERPSETDVAQPRTAKPIAAEQPAAAPRVDFEQRKEVAGKPIASTPPLVSLPPETPDSAEKEPLGVPPITADVTPTVPEIAVKLDQPEKQGPAVRITPGKQVQAISPTVGEVPGVARFGFGRPEPAPTRERSTRRDVTGPASVDGIRLLGLTSFDADPAAPGSDTRLALTAHRQAEKFLGSIVGHVEPGLTLARFKMAQVQSGRALDAHSETAVEPVASVTPPGQRSWQLFSPAKALSLSLMLSAPATTDLQGPALAGGTRRETQPSLGLALLEGWRALQDWREAEGPTTRRQATATAFGRVTREPVDGGVRVMRLGISADGALVQLYSEEAPSIGPADQIRESSFSRPATARALSGATPATPQQPTPNIPPHRPAETPRQVEHRTVTTLVLPSGVSAVRETRVTQDLPKATVRPAEKSTVRTADKAAAQPERPLRDVSASDGVPSSIATQVAPRLSLDQATALGLHRPERTQAAWRATSPEVTRAMALVSRAVKQGRLPLTVPSGLAELGSLGDLSGAMSTSAVVAVGKRLYQLPTALRAPLQLLTAWRTKESTQSETRHVPSLATDVEHPFAQLFSADTTGDKLGRRFQLEGLGVLQQLGVSAQPRQMRGRDLNLGERILLVPVTQGAPAAVHEQRVGTGLQAPSAGRFVSASPDVVTPTDSVQITGPPASATLPQTAIERIERPSAVSFVSTDGELQVPRAAAGSTNILRAVDTALGLPLLSPQATRLIEPSTDGQVEEDLEASPRPTRRWAAIEAFMPDHGMTGLSVDVSTILRFEDVGQLKTLLARLPQHVAETGQAAETKRPMRFAQVAILPEFVGLVDEVAAETPVQLAVARDVLRPQMVEAARGTMARERRILSVQPDGVELTKRPSRVVPIRPPARPDEATPAAGIGWASRLVERTEGFASRTIRRQSGQAPRRQIIVGPTGELISIVSAPSPKDAEDDRVAMAATGRPAQVPIQIRPDSIAKTPAGIAPLASVMQKAVRGAKVAAWTAPPTGLTQTGRTLAFVEQYAQVSGASEQTRRMPAIVSMGPAGFIPAGVMEGGSRPLQLLTGAIPRGALTGLSPLPRTQAAAAIGEGSPAGTVTVDSHRRLHGRLARLGVKSTMRRNEIVAELTKVGLTPPDVRKAAIGGTFARTPRVSIARKFDAAVERPTALSTEQTGQTYSGTVSTALVELAELSEQIAKTSKPHLRADWSDIRVSVREMLQGSEDVGVAPVGRRPFGARGDLVAPSDVRAADAQTQRSQQAAMRGQMAPGEVVQPLAERMPRDRVRPARIPTSAVGAPAGVSGRSQPPSRPQAGLAPAHVWSGFFDTVASTYGVLADRVQTLTGAFPVESTSWLEREISTLVKVGQALDLERVTQGFRPMGLRASRNMLSYVEGKAEAEPASDVERAKSRPGALVRPGRAHVQRTRTGLGQEAIVRPIGEYAAIQGERRVAQPELVIPSLALKKPDVTIQPLARVSGDLGQAADRGEVSAQTGTPPQDQVASMAWEIFDKIKEALQNETDRFGR